MSDSDALQAEWRRQIVTHGVVMFAVSIGYYSYQGWDAALAAIFGGAIVVISQSLQYWYMRRAERVAGNDAGRSMRILYRCAFERFAATVMLFVLGIGVLKLAPLPLLVGFIVGQLVALYNGFKNQA